MITIRNNTFIGLCLFAYKIATVSLVKSFNSRIRVTVNNQFYHLK